ncbi:hypothetical protein GTY88_02420, partial [Streptomyces sp. SID5926]|nr:hypothetical protein [Streptomyces sp. SID5926]
AAGPGDAGPGVDGSGARGGGPGVDGSGARDGGPEDRELLGRVFLARVLEPGDEAGGRWVREHGAAEVVRR